MVLALAVPAALGLLTTPLLGLVDTAVAGRLGDAAIIGGLAVGAIIIDLVFAVFYFLRAGTSGLTAQAFGAGDEKEKQAVLFRGVLIALGFGVLMVLVSPLIIAVGLWFMQPGEAVSHAARTYFLIRMLSTPAALTNYALFGWLIGLGRTGIGLALQTLLNGTNIVLSITLGLWMGWGIAGIAIATVIGEVIAAIVGGLIAWRMLDRDVRPSRKRILDRPALKRLTALNGDIIIRSFALMFAFAFFTAQGARFGEVTLAANAVLMHFFLVSGYFLDGLAIASEQLAGRSVGAASRKSFVRSVRLTLGWNVSQAALLTAFFLIFGSWLIDMMTTLEPVRAEARVYLLWAALIPLAGVLAFIMDGVYIGATWAREMRQMMLLSLAAYLLVWFLTRDAMANHGLWLALHIFVAVRGITLLARLPVNIRRTFACSSAAPV